MSLAACTSCRRHVREAEPACPFCSAPLERAAPRSAGVAPATADGRPTRGSLVFGTTLGAVAVSTVLFGTACPAYGSPDDRRHDAGRDASVATDAPAAMDAPSGDDAALDDAALDDAALDDGSTGGADAP